MTATRRLTMADLVIYGIVLIQPIAPVGIFGIADQMSKGHVTASILIAMAAMMITAWSYGRLAAVYPSAGSAYTYVGHAFRREAGFIVGWAMFLDYLIIPIISIVYAALTLERLFPAVPMRVWATLLTVASTALNLAGISSIARANKALLGFMTVVIVAFAGLSVRFLYGHAGWSGVISLQPIYNPATFDWHLVMTATSLAALTYIGFDGVTTLAEDVEDPRRTVPAATVLVCLLTGIFSAVEVYLGQMVWPDYKSFPNLETAFLDVTRVVGGSLLFQAMGWVLVVACAGTALTGQAAAARLLYGMGRDEVLPKAAFGRWDERRSQPSWNLCWIGAATLAGTWLISYQLAAEVLNFGAFLAFMGVNLAAFRIFWRAERRRVVANVVLPLGGFVFCLAIWWNLSRPAQVAGGLWVALGIVQLAVKTRGFQRPAGKFAMLTEAE
jgi:amino acid transporter